MALSADKKRIISSEDKIKCRTFPLASAAELYEGALVGVDASLYAKEAAKTTKAVGVCRGYIKNASSTAVDTTQYVTVDYGHVEYFANTAAAYSHLHKKVYAHADNSLSITSLTSAVSYIGRIVRVYLSTGYDVEILPEIS